MKFFVEGDGVLGILEYFIEATNLIGDMGVCMATLVQPGRELAGMEVFLPF